MNPENFEPMSSQETSTILGGHAPTVIGGPAPITVFIYTAWNELSRIAMDYQSSLPPNLKK